MIIWLHILLILVPAAHAQSLKHMRRHGHDHRHKNEGSPNSNEKKKKASVFLKNHEGSPMMKTSFLKNLHTPRDAAAESREMPLFVKFHKTGSGTAANIFRRHCPDAMRLFPDNRLPWRGGPRCGPLPHEHATIHLYRSLGRQGAEWCFFNRTRVSLFTVLRDPLDKFFSGAFFWKRELQKHGLHHIQEKLETAPTSLTVNDVNDLAKGVHWYGKEMGGKVFSARAGPLLQFTNIIGRTNVNDREQRDFPTPAIVDRACHNIRRDFTVGFAEAMDSFTVLVSLKTGWPLESLCTQDFHFNKNRPDSMRGASLRSALKPETLARLEEMLAPDRMVITLNLINLISLCCGVSANCKA